MMLQVAPFQIVYCSPLSLCEQPRYNNIRSAIAMLAFRHNVDQMIQYSMMGSCVKDRRLCRCATVIFFMSQQAKSTQATSFDTLYAAVLQEGNMKALWFYSFMCCKNVVVGC